MLDGTNAKTSDKLVYLAQIKADEALETDHGLDLAYRLNVRIISPLMNKNFKMGNINLASYSLQV